MKYTKINNSAFIGEDGKTVKVILDGVTYKTCALCERLFVIDGRNTKYCPHCRQKANSMKTSTRQNLV